MKFVADDTIMIKGKPAEAGSEILAGFNAPFSATVFERLQDAGLEFAGQTRADEFSVAGLFYDIERDSVKAAVLPEKVPEAITHVANGLCDIALCNDAFGRLRFHAPEHGLYYIHPTYGTVSRHGLIAAISSMDRIGIVCRSPKDAFKVLSIISDCGKTAAPARTLQPDAIKIGIPANVFRLSAGNEGEQLQGNAQGVMQGGAQDNTSARGVDSGFTKTVQTGLGDLNFKNLTYDSFELKYFDILHQTHYILACAEICNNTNRYDGIKFGYRTGDYSNLNELYLKTRTEGFGLDLKLAAIMGCMVLSRENYETCYLKAMQIRRVIKDYCEDLFSRYDLLAMPMTIPGLSLYEQSALYALPALAGLPSISVPFNKRSDRNKAHESGQRNGQESEASYGDKGIQLIAQCGNEEILWRLNL